MEALLFYYSDRFAHASHQGSWPGVSGHTQSPITRDTDASHGDWTQSNADGRNDNHHQSQHPQPEPQHG